MAARHRRPPVSFRNRSDDSDSSPRPPAATARERYRRRQFASPFLATEEMVAAGLLNRRMDLALITLPFGRQPYRDPALRRGTADCAAFVGNPARAFAWVPSTPRCLTTRPFLLPYPGKRSNMQSIDYRRFFRRDRTEAASHHGSRRPAGHPAHRRPASAIRFCPNTHCGTCLPISGSSGCLAGR